MTFSFFVPGVPVAKQYKQSKSGIIYSKGKVHTWEKTVAQAAMAAAGAGWKPAIRRVSLEFTFHFPIPTSRKELENNDWHMQDPDLTNLVKAVEDGIKRVLFADDNTVTDLAAAKMWCLKGQEGVHVSVRTHDE